MTHRLLRFVGRTAALAALLTAVLPVPPAAAQAGVRAGVQAGVRAGVQGGVRAGVQGGVRAGVQGGVRAWVRGGIEPDCPLPGCVSVTDDMRCHEVDWCVIPVFVTDGAREDVTVEVTTVDLTTTPRDYELVTRTVTIRAGERSADIVLWITGDREREQDEQFVVQIGEPSSGFLGNERTLVTVLNGPAERG